MSMQKAKDLRFTFKDRDGQLRAVVLRVEHHQERGKDRVVVNATADGVPLELRSFQAAPPPVKTRSRL